MVRKNNLYQVLQSEPASPAGRHWQFEGQFISSPTIGAGKYCWSLLAIRGNSSYRVPQLEPASPAGRHRRFQGTIHIKSHNWNRQVLPVVVGGSREQFISSPTIGSGRYCWSPYAVREYNSYQVPQLEPASTDGRHRWFQGKLHLKSLNWNRPVLPVAVGGSREQFISSSTIGSGRYCWSPYAVRENNSYQIPHLDPEILLVDMGGSRGQLILSPTIEAGKYCWSP